MSDRNSDEVETIIVDHIYDCPALYDALYYRSDGHKKDEAQQYAELLIRILNIHENHVDDEALSEFKIFEPLAGLSSKHKDNFSQYFLDYAGSELDPKIFSSTNIVTCEQSKFGDSEQTSAFEASPDTYNAVVAFYYALNSVLDDTTKLASYSASYELIKSCAVALKKGGVALIDFSLVTSMEDILDNLEMESNVESYLVQAGSALYKELANTIGSKNRLKLMVSSTNSYDRLSGVLYTKYDEIDLVECDPISDKVLEHLRSYRIQKPFSLYYMTENHVALLAKLVLDFLSGAEPEKKYTVEFGETSHETGEIFYMLEENSILTSKDEKVVDEEDKGDLIRSNVLIIRRTA